MVLHGFPSFCSTVDRGYYTVDVKLMQGKSLEKKSRFEGSSSARPAVVRVAEFIIVSGQGMRQVLAFCHKEAKDQRSKGGKDSELKSACALASSCVPHEVASTRPTGEAPRGTGCVVTAAR
jgi:hypothetical protein